MTIRQKLLSIIKNCNDDDLSINSVNKKAKALANFMNSSQCTKRMVKAIYKRFGVLDKSIAIIITGSKHAKQIVKKAQKLSNNENIKIHNSLIRLGDELSETNFNNQYHYRILFANEIHHSVKIIVNDPIDTDMIRKCANAMLFTIDRYAYKRQANQNKLKIKHQFNQSLKRIYSSHDLMEKGLTVLFKDYRRILVKCPKNTKDYGDYRQFVNDVMMLSKIKHSKAKIWSLKKEYIAYPAISSKSPKSKSIKKSVLIHIKKSTMFKMTLKQVLADNKSTERTDAATPADDNNIDFFWNLNDDVDVLDSILKTKSSYWVKDYICSSKSFINYAPVNDFKKHAKNYNINKYGEISSYGKYKDIAFPQYNRS